MSRPSKRKKKKNGPSSFKNSRSYPLEISTKGKYEQVKGSQQLDSDASNSKQKVEVVGATPEQIPPSATQQEQQPVSSVLTGNDTTEGLVKDESPATDTIPDTTVIDLVASQATESVVVVQNKKDWANNKKQNKRVQGSSIGHARKGIKELLIILTFMALLGPYINVVIVGMDAYTFYNTLHKQAQDGVAHLQNAQSIMSDGAKGDVTKYFDVGKLKQVQVQIDGAHTDFQQLNDELNQGSLVGAAAYLAPQQIQSARALVKMGVDATTIGQKILPTVIKLAPSIVTALKAPTPTTNTNDPSNYVTPTPSSIISASDFDILTANLAAIQPLMHDMAIQAQGINLKSLPLNDKEQKLLNVVVPSLPTLNSDLVQALSLKDEVRWFLGIGQPRAFLIQPLDRSELRSTGGFTGQFGELIFNGGHMSPLNLKNIGVYEEDHSTDTPPSPPYQPIYQKVENKTAPAPFTWWPIGNFGLRDSNMSADFPTSAKIAMHQYNYEFGQQVDGVISFTPLLIEHILTVTGPITVPKYNETITSTNLEERLHYYQLDNNGINKEKSIENVQDPEQARKLFSQDITRLIMSTVTHLPIDKMLLVVNNIWQSVKAKDMEIYVTNPHVEGLITKYGTTASIDTSTKHDGLLMVQSNDSANKGSQYVTTAMQDTITLDAAGNATHTLVTTLNYQEKGDVYGPDTYHDYMRVYVPPTSTFISGNGFDQSNQPYCGADSPFSGTPCGTDVYGDGTLICSVAPGGDWSTARLDDPYQNNDNPIEPLDVIGKPTNMTTDQNGRAMYGGWIVIPNDCQMKFTLSWTSPSTGKQPYSLLIQRQASVFPQLRLTIQPAPGTCEGQKATYTGTMDGEDTLFTLQPQGSGCSIQTKPFTD